MNSSSRSLALLLALLLSSFVQLKASPPQSDGADRTTAYETALLNHVNRSEYLRRLEFEWVWDYEGYVVIVQKPTNMAEGYVAKTAKLRVAESLAMHARFQEGIATRHNLSTRAKSPRMLILVLENYETLSGYLSVLLRQKMSDRTSYYDSADRILFLCETPVTNISTGRGEYRLRERKWRAMQIMQAYSSRSDWIPGPYWFRQGFSKELAGLNDRELTRDVFGKSTDWVFNDVCISMQDPKVGPIALPTLLELLSINDFRELWDKTSERALAAQLKVPDTDRIFEDFRSLSGALVQYLTYHASDDLIASMRSFTEAAFKDQLSKKPFDAHFKDVDWAAVEVKFWTYVWERWESENGVTDADRAVLEAIIARGKAAAPAGASGAVPASIKPASLLDVPGESDAQLVIAMASVLAGDPEAAAQRLESAIEIQPEATQRARLKTELVRVKAWIAERDAYLQHLVDSGDKLSLKLGGKKLLASVAKIEDGQILLGENNRDLNALPVKGLNPVELAGHMNGSKSKYSGGWAIAYPGAMDPDNRRKRWLSGDEPELIQLAADAKGDYKDRKDSILAAKHLVALSVDRSLQIYDDSELSSMEHLGELWASREDVEWIESLEQALPGRAASLLGKQFDDKPISDHLSVPFHPDSRGMIELVYDFSDPQQLKDWRLDPPSMHDWARYEVNPIEIAEPFLHVEGGRLKGVGAIARTHVLSLGGEQSLQWKQSILSGGNASSARNATVRIGICCDDEGGYAAAFHSMDLEVMEGLSHEFEYKSAQGFGNRFDEEYQRELRHDGKQTFSAFSSGNEIVSCSAPNRKEGRAQIFLFTDYNIELSQVVIRGQLTGDSFDGMREAWIDAGLAELGFQQ